MDDKIYMAEIIPLLPLPSPPYGRSTYYVPCPHCDGRGGKKDKHLNINLEKNVFRCPRCGWFGGIFDLYAFYTNIPRYDVRDELMRILKKGSYGSEKKSSSAGTQAASVIPAPPEFPEPQAVDIEIRHAAYSALLSMLSLAPDHEANLTGRGLSEYAIIKNGYKTSPVVGGRIIAKQLTDSGIQIEGVPGFYKDKSGEWTFIEQKRGILVPVRDLHGRIQGMQTRRDNVSKRKYRWVSSADIEGGTCGSGAEGWIHFAGPLNDRIILIEGPMKADIVFHLTGQTVAAIPGVNSLKHLAKVLVELRDQGLVCVMTAFDMDFLRNPHVQNGYTELVNLLGRMELKFGTYLWRPDYNGLDDYIWKCCLERGTHNLS